MIIEPAIRQNIAIHAHPTGCRQNVSDQIHAVQNKAAVTDKKLNVLIIGGSSGYGLSSRIVLGFNAKAYTCNVSFERGPKGRMTGGAGFYNNHFYNEFAKEQGIEADDFNGDCFSHSMKADVISLLKKKGKKIDLLIYSVASGIRVDPDTGEKYSSALKPIGSPYTGLTVDIGSGTLQEKELEPANEEEIQNTIKVMGGEDYLLWVQALEKEGLWNEGASSVTYTYVGTPFTYDIYKNGTIGQAKRNLEEAGKEIQKILDAHNGKSIVCSSKTVVTKASVFIPAVALYAGALFRVMKEKGTHESIVEHKYRLFKDMIFGDKITTDETGLYRLDFFELDDDTQKKVGEILDQVTPDNFSELVDFPFFKHEFLTMNGFDLNGVDYEADVDLSMFME